MLLITRIYFLLLVGCHQMKTHNTPINRDKDQLDYLLEDQTNLNHQIQDLIISRIMFTLVITIDHFNQIQHTKMRDIEQENHPQDFLQVEVINQSLLTVVLIHKLDMCTLVTMKNHSNQILITKLIMTTNHDNPQLDCHLVDLTSRNQMIQDLIVRQGMFTQVTTIDLFNQILITKDNQNIEIHNHKENKEES